MQNNGLSVTQLGITFVFLRDLTEQLNKLRLCLKASVPSYDNQFIHHQRIWIDLTPTGIILYTRNYNGIVTIISSKNKDTIGLNVFGINYNDNCIGCVIVQRCSIHFPDSVGKINFFMLKTFLHSTVLTY